MFCSICFSACRSGFANVVDLDNRMAASSGARLTFNDETRESVVHGSGVRAHQPCLHLGSGDADVVWASQVEHAVECMDDDRHLGRPALVRVRLQLVTDPLLPLVYGGFDPARLL